MPKLIIKHDGGFIMEYILNLDDTIHKEIDVFRPIETKFAIINPKHCPLDRLSAKYQLVHILIDPHDNNEFDYGDLFIEELYLGVARFVPRRWILGEPTIETIKNWVELYGKNAEYVKEIREYDNANYHRLSRIKNGVSSIAKKERIYESLFV